MFLKLFDSKLEEQINLVATHLQILSPVPQYGDLKLWFNNEIFYDDSIDFHDVD